MSDSKELEKWIEKIEETASRLGLSFYPQEFYVVSKQKMIEAMATHGGYPLYSHWSFGKSLKIGKILYEKNYFFMPYEVVINTNPSRAFLLESNPLHYNILVAAHVFGHNDFFKNNRFFKETYPEKILVELKNYRGLIKKFINDSRIGIDAVEKVIDAGHAMMFIPTNVDFFDFMASNGKLMKTWEKEIFAALGVLNNHLFPNIRTKIINEGWATFWHYRIVEELKNEISFDDYLGMRSAHLRVIRMPKNPGIINPYRVGFYLWKKVEEKHGPEAMFEIRKEMNDFEILLAYFNNENDFIYEHFIKPMTETLNNELASLSPEDAKLLADFLKCSFGADGKLKISPEERQELVEDYRRNVLESRGENILPRFEIFVKKTENGERLHLKHQYDGRPLDIGESLAVLKLIQALWRDPAMLETEIENEDGLYKNRKTLKFLCRDGRIFGNKNQ